MRVLVIEDHEDLAGVLARGLRRDGMAVDVALDGGEGWFKLEASDYDVVVLDRDLPVLHGDELPEDRCRIWDPVDGRVLHRSPSSQAQTRPDPS